MGKAVDELQLMTMLNGEYDHSNAILTFHAGTGGTEAQDWAEMLYRMYNKWAQAHGMTVESHIREDRHLNCGRYLSVATHIADNKDITFRFHSFFSF